MVIVSCFNIDFNELELISNTKTNKNYNGLLVEEQITISQEELYNICSEHTPTLNDDGRIYLESLLENLN